MSDYALRLIRPTGCITVTSAKPHGLEFKECVAVVLQFGDGVFDVVECQVGAGFFYAGEYVRAPAAGEFFDGGDVEVAVVEVGFEFGHAAHEEAAVLADGVAADGRLAFGYPLLQKRDGFRFGLRRADLAVAHALGEAGFAVLVGVPLVHGVEDAVGLMDGVGGAFGEDVEVGVGDQGGDFDDHVFIRVKAGHLQIDPDQVVFVLHL